VDKGKRKSIQTHLLLCVVLYAFSFIVALLVSRPLFHSPYSSVLYDKNEQLLGALVAADGQWRFPPGTLLNEKFVSALIEYEDRRFYYHPGIDPGAIARALWQNITDRRIVSGASTLTMQTIRLSRAPRRRTVHEKIIEMLLAFGLELGSSKKAILALYAAHAPFGANVVGIEAAAWRWFGRQQEDLSWADAATLAVLPNSPGLVHPGRNRETLTLKRNALLERLYQRGCFNEETLHLAKLEQVPAEPAPLVQKAPHLLMRLSLNSAHEGRIVTTIDAFLQERAEGIMNRWVERFSENGIDNAACLIMDTMTGAVRAYIGNVHTNASPAVDMITARRSSGSLLKPFLYAALLDSGDILPESLVSDIPTRIGSYAPENITQVYLGAVPADQALARSLNVPAVRLLRLYGVERFAQVLRSLGCTTLFRAGNDYGLPLILGGAEVTLWDMAGLYAMLTRTAFGQENPIFPPYVTEKQHAQRPRFSVGAAWLTLQALSMVARPGEEAAWQRYAGARQIAWKTGTSQGNRDAWSIGTTPEWTIAVWVGNASGEGRADLTSISKAAPVLFELFSAVNAGSSSQWIANPDKPQADLAAVAVCAASGLPAGRDCAALKTTFKPLSAPLLKACPYCRIVTLNSAEDREIIPQAGEPVVQKKWFVLPPAEEWYFRQWNLDYKPLPPRESASPTQSPLMLVNPEEGGQVFIPLELDGSRGRMVFSVVHREPATTVHWHLDEQYLGWTEVFHEMEAYPSAGLHTLTVVDAWGNTIVRHFTVLARDKSPQ
jgi:penicillin-binding protein 1C